MNQLQFQFYIKLARRTYREIVQQVEGECIAHSSVALRPHSEYARTEQEKIANCRLVYTLSRGYHFVMPSKNPFGERLPKQCIQVVRNRASVGFTTRDIIRFNGEWQRNRRRDELISDRLACAEADILDRSGTKVDELLSSLRSYLPSLYNLIEFIGQLDFFCSLASYAVKIGGGKSPTFCERVVCALAIRSITVGLFSSANFRRPDDRQAGQASDSRLRCE